MPFIPSLGMSVAGSMRLSCSTIREAPLVVSMAQTAPRVESEASKVVGLSVTRPLRNTAFSTTAVTLISGGLGGWGKWTRYIRFEPGVGDKVS